MSEKLVCLLAESSPQKWAQLAAQVEVAAEFSANPVQTAEQYAERLGMCRRHFFRLVSRIRLADAQKLRTHRSQRTSNQPPQVTNLVDHTIRDLGHHASPSNFLAEVQRRFDAARLTPPSTTASLRRLTVARRSNIDRSRAEIPDIIFDHCAMAINVLAPDESTLPGYLTAIVHGPSGSVLGHHVCMGEARSRAYFAALSDALSRPGTRRDFRTVKAVVQKAGGRQVVTLLRAANIEADSFTTSKRTYAYSLSRNLTGVVGHIRLMPRYRTGTTLPDSIAGPGVPLHLLRSVVDLILHDWNAGRSGPETIHEILSPSAGVALEKELFGQRAAPLAVAA